MARSRTSKRADDLYKSYLTKGTYAYTSEAFKLEPEYETPIRTRRRTDRLDRAKPRYERDTDSRVKRESPKRRVKVKRAKQRHNNQTQYVKDETKVKRLSFLSVSIIFTVFVGVVLCIGVFSLNAKAQYELRSLNSELKQVRALATSLEADTMVGFDLDEIARLASTELGMGKPKDYQIVYLEAPQTSYFTQYEAPKAVENTFSLARIMNMLFDR